MGTCTVKMQQGFDHSMPDLYYLDRERHEVLYITKSLQISTSFHEHIEFLQDSAVMYLSASEFFIAGGIKSTKKLSKKVYRINTTLKQTYAMPSLPLSTKYGDLIYFKNCIYLVGAVTLQDEKDYPSPLLRFCLNDQSWEVCEVNDLHLNAKYSMSNMLNAKVALIGSKIFMFAGVKALSQKSTKKVFSVDLNEMSLKIRLEKIVLPRRFAELKCIFTGKELLLCGSASGNASVKELLLYTFACKEWKEIGVIEMEWNERYPALAIGNKALFISYPNVLLCDRVNTYVYSLIRKQNGSLNEREEQIKVESEDSNNISSKSLSESSGSEESSGIKQGVNNTDNRQNVMLISDEEKLNKAFIEDRAPRKSSNQNKDIFPVDEPCIELRINNKDSVEAGGFLIEESEKTEINPEKRLPDVHLDVSRIFEENNAEIVNQSEQHYKRLRLAKDVLSEQPDPGAQFNHSSRRQKLRKKQIAAKYSQTNAPFLPSNIIISQATITSNSSSSNSKLNSDDESDSDSKDSSKSSKESS